MTFWHTIDVICNSSLLGELLTNITMNKVSHKPIFEIGQEFVVNFIQQFFFLLLNHQQLEYVHLILSVYSRYTYLVIRLFWLSLMFTI